MKARIPTAAGSREFGRKTRGKPIPPTRRTPAEPPPLSPIERAQEHVEEARMRREWATADQLPIDPKSGRR